MKAYVLRGIGQLDFTEVPMPKPKSGWAIVQVKAAGICGSDIPRIFQTGTYHFPTIPGHEFAGRVRQKDGSLLFRENGETVMVTPWGANSFRVRAAFLGEIEEGSVALLLP